MTERATKKARVESSPENPISRTKLKPALKLSEKSKGKQKETSDNTSSNPKPKKKLSVAADGPLPKTFKVVAGSYEKLLYGLEGTTTINEDSKLEFHLKPIFIFPAHVSCIKTVAVSPDGGKWLATGSSDEIIKVWDLRRRKEIGGLMHHEGSITHLSFPSRSHLMSASEDGTLCIFRARDWAVLRSFKGHKGRVNSIAIHPSGKVALSVGKDRVLRMWDMMRGKGVASTKIGKEGEVVRWSVDGSLFTVQSGSVIDVYTTDMTLIHTIRHASRLHDAKFVKRVNGSGEVMLVGAEDKKLSIYEVSKDPDQRPRIVAQMAGHINRVKAVQTLDIALPEGSGWAQTTIVCTVSSDGYINIYDLATVPEKVAEDGKPLDISPVASYDSKNTRFTCVALADGDAPVKGPEKRKRDDSGDESDGEVDNAEEDEFESWEGVEEEEGEMEEEAEEESD